jgi:hypothetical protein
MAVSNRIVKKPKKSKISRPPSSEVPALPITEKSLAPSHIVNFGSPKAPASKSLAPSARGAPLIPAGYVNPTFTQTAQAGLMPPPLRKKPADPPSPWAGMKNLNIDPITKKPWTALTKAELKAQPGEIQSYQASGNVPENLFAKGGVKGDIFSVKNPKDLTDKEYDALRAAAVKGNSLAQKILDQGKYKGKKFPTASQDIQHLLQPYVNQMQNLPAMGYGMQAELNNQMQNNTFTNAAGQVQSILNNMGMAGISGADMPAPTPATQNYINQMQSIVNNAPGITTPTSIGGVQIPSMESALEQFANTKLPSGKTQLGGAALSAQATGNEALTNALLSRLQNQIIWGTGAVPAAGTGTVNQLPDYIMGLLQELGMSANQGAITGTTPTVPTNQLPAAVTGTGNPSSTGG